MSYSDRMKDIHDKETSEIDKFFHIERNCSHCKTYMKVSIKNLQKKDYCKECKNNLSCLIDAVK
jgi:hypothetical protein